MKMPSKIKMRRLAFRMLWSVAACSTVVLLIAAVRKTDLDKCKGVNINITGVSNNFFIDQEDILNIIGTYSGKMLNGKQVDNFDLQSMEKQLEKDVWVKNAELFFDKNNILQVVVEEREPVARIFTSSGTTFYIDSSMMMLPLSQKFSARVPVFTGFPSEARVLAKKDSVLLKGVKEISLIISDDPFLMGMIDQIDITSNRKFEMIPKIGNQIIRFGDASGASEKFNKLKLFYKKVITQTGLGRYNLIDLDYQNQVIARVRGKEDVIADSLRTKELLQTIADITERLASDSSASFKPDGSFDTTIIMQSLQREESIENESAAFAPAQKNTSVAVNKPFVSTEKVVAAKKDLVAVTKPVTAKPKAIAVKKPVAAKPQAKKPTVAAQRPKAVMPNKQSDY